MLDSLEAWRADIDEEIERLLPRELTEEAVVDLFGPARYSYDTTALQKALVDPLWDLLDRGGKRWRPVLFLKLIEGVGGDPEDFLPYAIIPEILHTGTIIVDDVEDEATLRRGEEAIHLRYGTDVALNAGNALYFVPLKIISRNPADLPTDVRLRIFEMLTYELNRTHLGQGTDIVWHNEDAIDINEEEYLEMTACKTGCLGRIAGRLAAIVTDQPREIEQALGDYAESLSIAFQIGDDILDVLNTLDQAGEFGKAFGNDIHEGKRTLMAIHAVENAPREDADRLEAILTAAEVTDEDILDAIDIMREAGSIDYAKDRAGTLAEDARSQIEGLDIGPDVREELTSFTRFVIERET
ncbi:MAG: polyprenyl synthetase family protein [Halodesulfurarchaeum sp.]